MKKKKMIDFYFKRKERDDEEAQPSLVSPTSIDTNVSNIVEVGQPTQSTVEQLVQPSPSKALRIEQERINIDALIRDPRKRPRILDYPVNQQDEIRRAYIKFGPYQFLMDEYPFSVFQDQHRRFQARWFETFTWLEYSPEMDACYCFPCYLFSKKSSPFTSKGFRNWRKVNSGKDCSFLTHVGDGPNSSHNVALKCCEDFKSQYCHIDKVLSKQTSQQISCNRLRLKASADAVKWLTFQACAFRGHDESVRSKNRGNFVEMIKLLASYNREVDEVVLENAPQNAKYTSPTIQKEILHVFARKVQSDIRKEIGDAKFCLLVDEARDESKREKMAIVIRFVDKNGYVKERFLDMIHVRDTTSHTLKEGICSILSHHNLNIKSERGQGYDGASNMRGE
ncbi:uncharacterized protein LOC130746320 isoform X1 [Lotus japonicus]|uniref:uncharacterized protein LOC130746320 isoform X1 n=1 Tax=Lotus japonicus TaxID=34305 RepID=UPI00258AEDF5|nr:uncharacterized protein LOC130746320 isoform X1 [Lotus japonicus]XP_057454885.1 uncharacterized protein LOC130746320 isoform X1 [Lotus japonicus]XP_057454886.1 uncharacterized protein LOC130746320 isoform X1 [Lotus japonicus]